MALFKKSMMNIIRIWSQDYDHEKVFYDVVTIDLKTWTAAYNWNKSAKA
jgi:hypothetical protein